MTVEEIEILVTAKIEEALKEFAKLAPFVKKEIVNIQKEFDKIKIKDIVANIDISQVTKKVDEAKKQIKEAFDPDDMSGLKINGKLVDIKQIHGYSKEIQKLKGQIGTLNRFKPNVPNIVKENEIVKQNENTENNNTQNVSPQKIEQNKTTEVKPSNESFNIWDKLKQKIQEVKTYIKENVSFTFVDQIKNKFKNTSAEEELLKYKIKELKALLGSLNDEKGVKFDYSEVLEMKVELEELEKKLHKIQNNKSGSGNIFSGMFSSIRKLTPELNKTSGITVKIKNQINQWGSKVKNGLGQVLKYASALFGLRTIYNTLQQCASTWLSSQNTGAQQLSANINYMKYAMGSALAPIIQFITNLVYKLMKAIQQVAYALTGVNIFANATANSMNNTTKNAKKATKAMKALAGVHDEINNISDNSGSDGGDSGSGSVGPSFDLSQMDNTSNSILDAIKNGNWYQVGAEIANKLNEAMASIDWTKIQEKAKTIANNIGNFINGFVDKFNWNLLGATIGNGINTALIFLDTLLTTINFQKIGSSIATTLNSAIKTTDWKLYGKTLADGINTIIDIAYGFVTKFDFKNFGTSIATGINSFFENIKWVEIGQTLTNGIKGIFDGVTSFIQKFDWKIIIDGLVTFLKNVDITEISRSLFTMIGSACGSLINLGATIGEYIKKAFTNIGQYFNKEIEDAGGNIIQGIFNGIINALRNLGNWIINNIFKPFINGFKGAFGIHSPSTVMAEMGGYIIEGLKNGVKGIWDKIKSIFETLKTNIANKFAEIVRKIKEKFSISTIKEHFSNAVTGIKDKFSTIQDWFKSKFSNVVSKVKSAFSLSTIKSHFNNVVSGIKNVFSNIPNWFKTTFSNAWQKVKNVFSKGGKVFTGIKEGILTSLKGVINGLISGINKVIKIPFDGINKALNKIREIELFGKRPFGGLPTISVPQIPKLAKGNVAYNETLAIFGEYSGARNNPEITAPQNIMYETMLKALADSNSNNNNNTPIYLTVKVGNKILGQILIDDLKDKRRRTGKGIEAIVGG